jgi:hypothetical protein
MGVKKKAVILCASNLNGLKLLKIFWRKCETGGRVPKTVIFSFFLIIALILQLTGRAGSVNTSVEVFKFQKNEFGLENQKIKELVDFLRQGNQVIWDFKETPFNTDGSWKIEVLKSLLEEAGDLRLASAEFSKGSVRPYSLRARGVPSVLLIENISTVSPVSAGLLNWNFPFEKKDFSEIENNPSAYLDVSVYDLVVFTSPGWWRNFANPPSGPSRVPTNVRQAIQDFVKNGGSALFVDIAQWDFVKVWPRMINLSPLGPYRLDEFRYGNVKGNLSLAPFGVGANEIKSSRGTGFFFSDDFVFPDGKKGEVFAAMAFSGGDFGKGIALGQAFHTFEQSDSLADQAQRFFINFALLSGKRRLTYQSAEKAGPVPEQPSTMVPSLTFTRTVPTATYFIPTATSTLTPVFTSTYTLLPTLTLTPEFTPWPEPVFWSPPPTIAPPVFLKPTPTLTPFIVTPPPPPLISDSVKKPQFFTPTPFIRNVPSSPGRVATPAKPLAESPPKKQAFAEKKEPVRRLPAFDFKDAVNVIVSTATATPTPSNLGVLFLEKKNMRASVLNSLGGLYSAPEPFGVGGVYLYFILKQEAEIFMEIFKAEGDQILAIKSGLFKIGKHQIFYDARDKNGNYLAPGRYFWRITAKYNDYEKESRQAWFNMRSERSGRR